MLGGNRRCVKSGRLTFSGLCERGIISMRPLATVDEGRRERVRSELAAELEAEPKVAFAYLYGSFLEPAAFHDVDVGVYLRVFEPDRAGALGLALAERLTARVGLPVDVRILNSTPVSFLYHVLRGSLVFSRDEALLGEVIERTLQRYLDIAPLLRHSAKEAFAA